MHSKPWAVVLPEQKLMAPIVKKKKTTDNQFQNTLF
jgi:hypothetical protein